MAMEMHPVTQLDELFSQWLASKGINPNLVSSDYRVERIKGQTWLHLTLHANDFMPRYVESEPELHPEDIRLCANAWECYIHQPMVDHRASLCLNPDTCPADRHAIVNPEGHEAPQR